MVVAGVADSVAVVAAVADSAVVAALVVAVTAAGLGVDMVEALEEAMDTGTADLGTALDSVSA